MDTTNITIKMEEDLALDAKVLAARKGTSLSRLQQGLDLDWKQPDSRDELHQREDLR